MEDWTSNLLTSLLIVVITVVLLIVLQIIARRVYKYLESAKGMLHERRQQIITFTQILTWSASVVVVCVALLMVLSELGVDITPLLASAGIAGLAISLGAQNLIKEFIGGFLILFGDQYVVGDTIEVGSVSGQVERVTLRVTYIRDARGIQYLVPNGEIRTMANHNKGWARALVDINIAYGQDPDHIASVLQAAADTFANNPDFSPSLLDKPEVSGPTGMGDWSITMRVTVKTKPDQRLEITRELQKYLLQACAKENISLPYPRQDLTIQGSQ